MRHRVSGKQLSRTTAHRRSLRRNMAASLFEHGAIRTTEAKAKELRRFVERLITLARRARCMPAGRWSPCCATGTWSTPRGR